MLCLIGMAASLQAQTISGKLADKQNQPLAYANVVLISLPDSIFVTGEITDEKGGFRFSKVTEGDYQLKISSMGYEPMFIDLQGFKRSTNLGTLTMNEATEMLDEVSITASNITATANKKNGLPKRTASESVCQRGRFAP